MVVVRPRSVTAGDTNGYIVLKKFCLSDTSSGICYSANHKQHFGWWEGLLGALLNHHELEGVPFYRQTDNLEVGNGPQIT